MSPGLAAFVEHGPRWQDACLLVGERFEERELHGAFEDQSDHRRPAVRIDQGRGLVPDMFIICARLARIITNSRGECRHPRTYLLRHFVLDAVIA